MRHTQTAALAALAALAVLAAAAPATTRTPAGNAPKSQPRAKARQPADVLDLFRRLVPAAVAGQIRAECLDLDGGQVAMVEHRRRPGPVAWDVTKTDSLVSPYTGWIRIPAHVIVRAPAGSRAAARSAPIEWERDITIRLDYAFQGGKWIRTGRHALDPGD